jgi:hypothetical protein
MLRLHRMPPFAPLLRADSRLGAAPIWGLLLVAGVIAVGFFASSVAQRLPCPHELEWMEGALADHAWRVAEGLPLYAAPTPEHVPFLYAPLLFWLGALGIHCGLDGIVALRLVATACTVATAMLIGHWVRVASGRLVPGLVAAGLFVAGYGWLAYWYDLARNDSLFVFACLATAYTLQHGPRWRWLLAALLATVALLAKQSALMWLPAVGVGALCLDWRLGLRFGAACVVLMGIAIGALHLGSDGWSTFYLFTMPGHHGWVGDRKLGFWTEDVVPMLPALLLGGLGFVVQWRQGARGPALFLAAVGSGGLLCSWLSRLHVGGFDNVMMYGFAAACVLAPIAAGERPLRHVGPLLLVLQFGLLGVAPIWRLALTAGQQPAWLGIGSYGVAAVAHAPARLRLPTAAHRQAHDELAAYVRAQPGPVWIPAHGHVGTRAGKGTGAHGQAVFDLMQLLPKLPDGMFDLAALFDRQKLAHLGVREQEALAALLDGTAQALRERRFAAIVVDEVGAGAFVAVFAAGLVGDDGQLGTADDTYVRAPGALLTDPQGIAPLLGYVVHSPYALVPRR